MIEWLCSFALVAQMFCSVPGNQLTGYIEGESLFVAPLDAARISELSVQRGQRVERGDVLALLERDDAEFAYAAAQAQVAQARAVLQNLSTGKRAEEIAVLKAAEGVGRADLEQKRLDFERVQGLVARNVQSQSALDAARTARDVSDAHLRETQANLQVAHIAARAQEIVAAEHAVEAVDAQAKSAAWRLEQRTLRAPQAGVLEEVLRYPGETSGPNAPVFLLLPDGRRKVRVFVPEPWVSRVRLGDEIALACDGCDAGMHARVNFIASAPEYTPPVIYSVESRQKLVVLIEAEPLGPARELAPGQIVEVTFPKFTTGTGAG